MKRIILLVSVTFCLSSMAVGQKLLSDHRGAVFFKSPLQVDSFSRFFTNARFEDSKESSSSIQQWKPSGPSPNIIIAVIGAFGPSLPNYRLDKQDDETKDAVPQDGFVGGALLQFIFARNGNFSLYTGLMFESRNTIISDEPDFSTYKDFDINGVPYEFWEDRNERLFSGYIPLMVEYKTPGKVSFRLATGFNFGQIKNGEYRRTLKDELGRTRDINTGRPYNVIYAEILEELGEEFVASSPINIGNSSISDLYQSPRIDFVIRSGGVVTFDNGLMVGADVTFQQGLTNIYNDFRPLSTRKLNSVNFTASIGYPIGGL